VAVYSQEFSLAVLLQQLNVWSLQTVSTCFIRGQVFHKSQAGFEKSFRLRPVCASDGKKTWKTKQEWGVADEELSVLCVIDTGCEIKRVNYQC
jgi:hypothetical protein